MTITTGAATSGRLFAAALLAGVFALPAMAIAQDSPPAQTTVKRDVIYVPTPQAVVDRMLEMSKVTKDDYVIDLGSGDGRIPISAAKLGARALGVEIDPQRLKEAAENLEKAGPEVAKLVEFRNQNLFETDLSEARVITMYLLNSINLKLRPKILELEPGTRIVAHAFNMGDWEPDETDTVDGKQIYYWLVPAKVDGAWRITTPEGEVTATIKQTYQKIEGTASVDGKPVELADATLRGDRISFTIPGENGAGRTFVGTVDGDSIAPAADAGEDAVKGWSASRG